MPRKARPIRICGEVAYVTLTKGYVAVIDAADVPLIEGTNWTAQCKCRDDGSVVAVYAIRKITADGRRCTERMHRVIFHASFGQEVDHHDKNGLNNRRANLRDATGAQNSQNRGIRIDNKSGVKGVWWSAKRGVWMAYIGASGERKHLGYFEDKMAAADAVAQARSVLHGEFGRAA